jgi:hypothetical protein
VSRLSAALLIALLSTVSTLDLVACPDGCADESPMSQTLPTAPSVCPLCHGWSAVTIAVTYSPPVTLVIVEAPAVTPERTPHLPRIEHPPKGA